MKTRTSNEKDPSTSTTTLNPKSKLDCTPVVEIERMSEIDKSAPSPSTLSKIKSTKTKASLSCFLCGEKTWTLLTSLKQVRRHYMRQVEVFKSYLNNGEFMSLLPSTKQLDDGDSDNIETCTKCLKEIKEVWDMDQQIEAIKEDIQIVLKRVIAVMPEREGEGKSNSKENGHIRRKNPSGRTSSSPTRLISKHAFSTSTSPRRNPTVQIKEDIDEVHFDATDNESCFAINPEFDQDSSPEKMEISENSPSPLSRPKRQSRLLAEKNLRRVMHSETNNEKVSMKDDPGEDDAFMNEAEAEESDSDSVDDSESKDLLGDAPKTKRRKKNSVNSNTVCEHCGKEFTVGKSLLSHIRRVHLLQHAHKCTECDKTFVTAAELSSHTSWNHKGEFFPCAGCQKKLATRKRWAMHEATVCKVDGWTPERLKEYNITLLPCSFAGCDKAFDRPSGLNKHLPTHTGSRPFQCPTCDKSFTQKTSLNQHTALFCGPSANAELRSKMLKRQRENSLKEKQFFCLICRPKRGFLKAITLAEHNSRFHPNGGTPEEQSEGVRILCDLCGVAMRPGQRSLHMRRVHEGHRNVSCPDCGRRFFSLKEMRLHLNRVHNKTPPSEEDLLNAPKHICEVCGQEYRHQTSLNHHMAQVHRDPDQIQASKKYRCPNCPRRFYKPSGLQKHLDSHNKHGWWCVDCGLNFNSQRKLEEHQENLDGKLCQVKIRKKPKNVKKGPRQGERDETVAAVGAIVEEELAELPYV